MISESLLSFFSHENNQPAGVPTGKDPLCVLRAAYPDLNSLIRGKSVLDFGCGHGDQAAALAKYARVTGLDTNLAALARARANHAGVPFVSSLDAEDGFDVVISQNAMEHFPDPGSVLESMRDALVPNGLALITFGPPWYAPYGSHMHFFCRIPWLNLLFPEKTVMAVRAKFRHDGAQRYTEVESGLNKMSLAKFERLICESGFEMMWRKYTGIRGMAWLTRIPVIRELCTVHVTVILKKST
jgi:SAM-dependent methyltransferase